MNIDYYKKMYEDFMKTAAELMSYAGDPKDAVAETMKIVGVKNPPLRLALGKGMPELLANTLIERANDYKTNNNE